MNMFAACLLLGRDCGIAWLMRYMLFTFMGMRQYAIQGIVNERGSEISGVVVTT